MSGERSLKAAGLWASEVELPTRYPITHEQGRAACHIPSSSQHIAAGSLALTPCQKHEKRGEKRIPEPQPTPEPC